MHDGRRESERAQQPRNKPVNIDKDGHTNKTRATLIHCAIFFFISSDTGSNTRGHAFHCACDCARAETDSKRRNAA